MKILPSTSIQYCTLKYKANMGNTDVASLRKLVDKNDNDAVKVTISREAQELFDQLVTREVK